MEHGLTPHHATLSRSYAEGGGECFMLQLQRVTIMVSSALLVPIGGNARTHPHTTMSAHAYLQTLERTHTHTTTNPHTHTHERARIPANT
jgi:hypothetical protein